MRTHGPRTWPILLLAAPAFVAIWSGWVGLGKMAGFGPVTLLPGLANWTLDTAITLPIGMETYAAYAIRIWLTGPAHARPFARRSAFAALGFGMAGQVCYHLMVAAGWQRAPWPVVILVSCVPVVVLGMGAALTHLVRSQSPVVSPAGVCADSPKTRQPSDENFENLSQAPTPTAPRRVANAQPEKKTTARERYANGDRDCGTIAAELGVSKRAVEKWTEDFRLESAVSGNGNGRGH